MSALGSILPSKVRSTNVGIGPTADDGSVLAPKPPAQPWKISHNQSEKVG